VSIWLQHALALLLAAAVPAWDYVETRRLRRATDPQAKVQAYRRIVAVLWGLTVVAAVAVPPSDLLHPPALGGAIGRLASERGAARAVMIGILAALGAQLLIPLLVPRARARLAGPLAKLGWFLPSSPAERRWWVAVCVSAGVCEEVLYRGFLLRYLAGGVAAQPPFGLGGTSAVLVAALLFGAAHTYQGAVGILSTAAAAILFTALCVATGSLWLPMLVHTLIDLRVLLLWPAGGVATPADAVPGSAGAAG
jgi:membrane protease YdiL (CAAX protease family)